MSKIINIKVLRFKLSLNNLFKVEVLKGSIEIRYLFGDTFSNKKLVTFLLIVSLALFLLKSFLWFVILPLPKGGVKIISPYKEDKKMITKQYKFTYKKKLIK